MVVKQNLQCTNQKYSLRTRFSTENPPKKNVNTKKNRSNKPQEEQDQGEGRSRSGEHQGKETQAMKKERVLRANLEEEVSKDYEEKLKEYKRTNLALMRQVDVCEEERRTLKEELTKLKEVNENKKKSRKR